MDRKLVACARTVKARMRRARAALRLFIGRCHPIGQRRPDPPP